MSQMTMNLFVISQSGPFLIHDLITKFVIKITRRVPCGTVTAYPFVATKFIPVFSRGHTLVDLYIFYIVFCTCISLFVLFILAIVLSALWITVSNYPINVSNYPINVSNYLINFSNYPINVSNYPINFPNYPINVSNYPFGIFKLFF